MSPWGWDESPGHWAGCFQLWQCRQLLSCLPTSLANAVQLVALNAISQTEAQAAQAPATEQEEAGVTMTRKNTTGAAGKAFETLIFQTSWNSRWFQSIQSINMYQVLFSTLRMRQHPHMSVRIPSRPSFNTNQLPQAANPRNLGLPSTLA